MSPSHTMQRHAPAPAAQTTRQCQPTRLLPGLDYLSDPKGAILEAQKLAAAAFGAEATWFLVNGSTVGIHTAVLSTCEPGDTLLVARNCHLSAFSAMALTGCTPWWIHPEVDAHHGMAHCCTPQDLEAALHAAQAAGRKVAAAMVVSPTYFGACSRIADLADVCHSHHIPLIVDEAHGAHLAFHSDFPATSLSQGADLVIQSTHKMLSGLTQSAMLHARGQRVPHTRISRALQMLQSSSPSYLLLSCLDAARAQAQQPETFQEPLLALKAAAEAIRGMPGLSLVADACSASSSSSSSSSRSSSSSSSSSSSKGASSGKATHLESVVAFDPMRLAVNVRGLGLTGYQAADILEKQYRIVPEMSTSEVVLLVGGPGTSRRDCEALVSALKDISELHNLNRIPNRPNAATNRVLSVADKHTRSKQHDPEAQQAAESSGHVLQPRGASESREGCCREQPTAVLSPRDAFFQQRRRVPLRDAVGQPSGELLCPYPPGVPVIFPGEMVTPEAAEMVQEAIKSGGVVTGASDGTLATMLVLGQLDSQMQSSADGRL